MKRLRLVVAIVLVACSVVVAQQKLDVELQLAVQREMASGDLKTAIVEYRRIAERAQQSDRAVASRALLRLAEAHAKLGQAEARGIYERLVRDFGDQKESATARARLLSAVDATPSSRPQTGARMLWNSQPSSAIDSVSYDGRYGVLSADDEGSGELPVFDMATGAVRRLGSKPASPQSRDYVETGAFSRDTTLAAYSRFSGMDDRFEVWIANVTGDPNPRGLFRNDKREFSYLRVTDWSPDRSRIAVQFSRPGAATEVNRGIGFISVSDGTLHELKRLPWEWSPATFSPDGRWLAGTLAQDGRARVSTTLDQEGDVFVLPADGGNLEVIAPHPAADMFAGWSPDGSLLLFVSNRGGSDNLWAIRVADGRPQGNPFVVRPGFSGELIGVTSTGALHYRTRSDSGADVLVVGFDFSSGRRTSAPLHVSGIGPNYRASARAWTSVWSPDSRQLAYVSRRGQRYDLVISSLEAGPREIARNVGFLDRLIWSSDGRFIVGERRGTGGGIFKIDVQSGQLTQVTDAVVGEQIGPSLSRDGKTLYFGQRWRDQLGVALMSKDLASGDERELIRISGASAGISNVSPDGTKVYYTRTYPDISPGVISVVNTANEHAIIERHLGTGIDRELIRRGTPQARQTLGRANLSPDGRHIATPSTDVAARTISLLLVAVDTSEVRELLKLTQPGALTFMTWAPDSRSLVVSRRQGTEANEQWWIPLDGRAPQKLETGNTVLHISPDGQRYAHAITTPGRPAETWVLERFLPLTPSGR